MKGNWTQILVFTVLFLILGFVLGRVTGHRGHHGEHMEKRIIKKHMVWHDDEGHSKLFISEGEEAMTVTAQELEESGFEGDTIVDGANISITRDGDEVKVEVKKEIEGEGPGKRIKKRIEKEIDKD